MLRWATPSASVCRSSSAARTPRTWRFIRGWNVPCRAVWWVFRRTLQVNLRTGWHCRPASSTSAVRRPPVISVPPRLCWRLLPVLTPCITAPRGCALLLNACTRMRHVWPLRCRRLVTVLRTRTSSTPLLSKHPVPLMSWWLRRWTPVLIFAVSTLTAWVSQWVSRMMMPCWGAL